MKPATFLDLATLEALFRDMFGQFPTLLERLQFVEEGFQLAE